MSPRRTLLAAVLLAVAASGVAHAQADTGTEFTLPALLSDGCVLQRNTRVALWGRARAGADVAAQVSWSGRTYSAEVRPDGSWWLPIPTPDAGGPYAIGLRSDGRDLRIEDVWIGEVWLCAGQSNMEMPLAPIHAGYTGVADHEAELAAADRPTLRVFDVPNAFAAEPRTDCEGAWRACTPANARTFSATATFFGLELQRELDVPVGLITTDFGGTRIESWMSAQALGRIPGFERRAELLAGAGDDALAGAQRAAAEEWVAETERREERLGLAWTERDAVAGDWRGVLHLRLELEPGAEPVELRLTQAEPWLDVRCNGELVRRNAPGPEGAPARDVRVPAELLNGASDVLEVRFVASASAGELRALDERVAVSRPARRTFARGLDALDLPRFPRDAPLSQHTPTALFNAMVVPVLPFAVRGFVWYQGESNVDRPELYRELFPALIADWRALWRSPSAPFLFVQLAPFGYDPDRGRPGELRDAQRDTLAVAGTAMAVTLDVGDPADVHPKSKRAVGTRLARLALARVNGASQAPATGPLDVALEVEDGAAVVRFENVAGGLVAAEGGLRDFELAGVDGVWHAARAEVRGDRVVVSCAEVREPRAVRYAHDAADAASLFGGDGLPAPSFVRARGE